MRMMFMILTAGTMMNFFNFIDAAEHTKDPLTTVKKRVESNEAVLIDVREQEEWDEGHLHDARLVPLSALINQQDRMQATKTLPQKKIIYCHCRSGVRVLKATDILKAEGFDIRPLKEGYSSLLKAGFKKAESSK